MSEIHDADEPVSNIVAKRLVEHLQATAFVVMKAGNFRRYGW